MIKVGVIGAGSMGKNHIRNYLELNNLFEFVGFYDASEENAKKTEELFNIKSFKTIEELLDNVDAVSVVVPSSLHKEIGLIVASKKVHALIEKPLALNKEDCEILSRAFKENNLVLSVDVTAPDGSPMWSGCFDRHVIGDVSDYLVFMAYDQHNDSSNPGTVAGYDWIEIALNKFVGIQEDVESEKIILGMPFYTRLWKEVPKTAEELEAQQGTEAAEYAMNVTSIVYGMSGAQQVVANSGAEIVVDELTGQNYAEWEADGGTYKIWLEDKSALETKLQLMKKYELAGTAAWRLGFEQADTWELILKYVN